MTTETLEMVTCCHCGFCADDIDCFYDVGTKIFCDECYNNDLLVRKCSSCNIVSDDLEYILYIDRGSHDGYTCKGCLWDERNSCRYCRNGCSNCL